MPAYRKGTEGYKKSKKKTRETLIAKYGGEEGMRNFFREIGRRGGLNGHDGGFASNHKLAKTAGAKGGSRSRRGFKLIEEDDKILRYKNIKTGEISEVSKDEQSQD